MKMKTSGRSAQKAKPLRARAWFAAGVGCAVLASTKPASAIDPATAAQVAGYVKAAYDVYKAASSMLGNKAPSLAQQLRQVEAAIIGEMRTQRNQALKSNASTVFSLYRNLSDNSRSDPTNPSLYNEILTLQTQTAIAMGDIVWYANDPASSYELAPAMNALVATGVGVLRIKGEIWPQYPSSWADYHYWLLGGIQVNYTMVGSLRHECWPGTNPGWRPMPANASQLVIWLSLTRPGRWEESQLYKYLMNKYIATGPYAELRWGCNRVTIDDPGGQIHCNPVTDTCRQDGACRYNTPSRAVRVSGHQCGTVSALDCAEKLAYGRFRDDPTVEIIHASMNGIMALSGGNQASSGSNNSLPASGKYVDPWVNEPSCPASAPWAYPHLP
ncbi:MAG TPA: hypothetical protein VFZ53_23025 [Polyangiaceae bacterium]